jgi:predicted NBD/HSP70 family sugar kinase
MRIGIDLGGTKIEVVALSTTGREVFRRRVPTPKDDYEQILRAVVELVADAENKTQTSGTVGIATPGAISPATGRVKNSNTVCLIGRPLQQNLERALSRPVRISNDANCLALSEATDGSAAGAEVVFSVIIGSGTGGGVVMHGKVVTGPNAVAGEWGHNPLPWPRPEELPGPPCYCGKRGCIETFLSGPGLSRDHEAATGASLSAQDIASLADQGSGQAAATLQRYVDRIARGLASVINVLDPDVIVLGGGLSNITRLYTAVPEVWHKYVFSDVVVTRLVQARHGDSSGVRGAAALWPPAASDHGRTTPGR